MDSLEKPSSNNTLLVILLVVAAFVIGMLYTKVQSLQKGGENAPSAGTAAGTQQAGAKPQPLHVPKAIGMDEGKFKTCLESGKYTQKVAADLAEGQKAGVSGTPGTLVNGQLVVGAVPYAQFKAILDEELATPNHPLPSGAPRVTVDAGSLEAMGQAAAPITVVEFADFQCPFCKKFHNEVLPSLIKDYIKTGKVKFAFRNYAFLGPESNVAAEGAYCAQEQGKFWEYHNFLYDHQGTENAGYFTKENLE